MPSSRAPCSQYRVRHGLPPRTSGLERPGASRSVRVLNPMTKEESERAGIGEERRFYFRAEKSKREPCPAEHKRNLSDANRPALTLDGPDDPLDNGGSSQGRAGLPRFARQMVNGVRVSDLRQRQAHTNEDSDAKTPQR